MTQTRCTTCPRPAPDVSFGCPACGSDLAQRLDQLAAWLPEMETTIAKLDRIGSGGPKAAGAEVPLPYRPDVAEKRHAIRGELTTWARVVVEESGRKLPGHGWVTSAALARYLGGSADFMRYRQEWPEFYAALRPLAGSAMFLIDRPEEKVYLGPCETRDDATGAICRADVLARRDAAKGRCRACGTVHDVAESREWLLDSLEDVLARPVEIAGVLRGFGDRRVGYSTIAAYVASGQLVPHGQDGHGKDRFRIGDVLDLRYPNRHRVREGEALAS